MEYYNGLVFQGYLKALPRPLLKGGRYDLLMQQFTPGAGAIGFAVYLDELDRLSAPLPPVQKNSTDRVMLNVALPKGRLGDKVYNLLAGIGYGCPEDYNATRKLVVENPEAGIRYFLVKPSDVRSEEHTSELQSPYVISYAVFCLKKSKRLAKP